QSSGDDDIHQLIEEFEREVGIPETRLRVRRVEDQPRITRTRQSERIRAAILSRIAPSRRHTSAHQEESSLGMILPDEDDDSGHEFEERLGGAGGSSLLVTALTRTRIGGNSSIRRRKRIATALDANPATADSINILSNIMDRMDRMVSKPEESEK
ncbi:hypothetical protein Bhyg_14394, partial [Pseudolycoriella hygida]